MAESNLHARRSRRLKHGMAAPAVRRIPHVRCGGEGQSCWSGGCSSTRTGRQAVPAEPSPAWSRWLGSYGR